MEEGTPFMPRGASSVLLAVTSGSAAIQIGSGTPQDIRSAKLANLTSVPCYVEFGSASTVAATVPGGASIAGSMCVPANTERVFTVFGCNFLAATTSAGTTNLAATPGQGGV